MKRRLRPPRGGRARLEWLFPLARPPEDNYRRRSATSERRDPSRSAVLIKQHREAVPFLYFRPLPLPSLQTHTRDPGGLREKVWKKTTTKQYQTFFFNLFYSDRLQCFALLAETAGSLGSISVPSKWETISENLPLVPR